jgi:CO/xanthine dehydrogenase Mo-binding subunit
VASFVHCTGFAPSRIWRSPSRRHIERAGGGAGFESAEIKVAPSGKVWVGIGTSPHGQSGATTTAQIVADNLGVPFDDVEVQYGDTAVGPWGMVEVDPETGDIELKRYVAVDDCGVQINPLVVEGQIHGATVQGIGQALWEQAVYDDDGQLMTARA